MAIFYFGRVESLSGKKLFGDYVLYNLEQETPVDIGDTESLASKYAKSETGGLVSLLRFVPEGKLEILSVKTENENRHLVVRGVNGAEVSSFMSSLKKGANQ